MSGTVRPLERGIPYISQEFRGRTMDFLIHHILRTSAMQFPEKEALVHGEQRLTYSAVASQVAGLACSLREAGLQRGDRLGIYFDPSIPQVLSIFGVAQAGGVL